jgi:hypothetical protein
MREMNFISSDEKSNSGGKEVLLQLTLESPNELSPFDFSSSIIIKIIDPLLVLLLKKGCVLWLGSFLIWFVLLVCFWVFGFGYERQRIARMARERKQSLFHFKRKITIFSSDLVA